MLVTGKNVSGNELAHIGLMGEKSALYVPSLKEKLEEIKVKNAIIDQKSLDVKSKLVNFNYNRMPNY